MIKEGKMVIAFDGDFLKVDDGEHHFSVPLENIWFLVTASNNLRTLADHPDFPELFRKVARDKIFSTWHGQLKKMTESVESKPSDPKAIIDKNPSSYSPTDPVAWQNARTIGKAIYDVLHRQMIIRKVLRGRLENLERIWKNQKPEAQYLFVHAGLDLMKELTDQKVIEGFEGIIDAMEDEVDNSELINAMDAEVKTTGFTDAVSDVKPMIKEQENAIPA